MVARKFRGFGLDQDDLVQEALTALCAAARNYDPSKCAFSTWSATLMVSHLRDVVRSDTRMGSFGGRGANSVYPNALRKYIRAGGDDLSMETLRTMFRDTTGHCGLTDYDIGVLLTHTRHKELSLDVPVHEGESPGSMTLLVDTLVDEGAEERHEDHEYAMDRERVMSQLEITDPRDRDIMLSRVLSDEPETLLDIGKRWGVSRERIRQLEARLIHCILAKLERDPAILRVLKDPNSEGDTLKSRVLKGNQ